jgi:integrase
MPQSPLDADVDDFLDARRTWSKANVTNATSILNRFTRWLAETHRTTPAAATRRQCRDYLDHVASTPTGPRAQPPKAATVQIHYRMLKAFYKWGQTPCADGGLGLASSPMSGVDAPRVVEPVMRTAKPAEVERLFAALDRSYFGKRDRAMLSVMFHNGLRVGELPHLELDGYRVVGDGRAWLLVPKTKTDVAREIPVDPITQRHLRHWLDKRGRKPGPLFVGQPGRTTDPGGRLTADSIREVIDRAAVRAGVPVSCHQLRRAFVVAAKRRGMSDATICQICGWTSVRMMMRYLADERANSAFDDFYRHTVTEAPAERAVADTATLRRTVNNIAATAAANDFYATVAS